MSVTVYTSIDLPPRVRGARHPPRLDGRHTRLTPACAGSTRPRQHPSAAPPTYPRVCGEHAVRGAVRQEAVDLPPRVRGAPEHESGVLVGVRLTPACAGSTGTAAAGPVRAPTYPRVCGEHSANAASRTATGDLPPRVRGAPRPRRCRHGCCRLTPACAGSTLGNHLRTAPESTYPRVCGEHVSSDVSDVSQHDLPPRVRGARNKIDIEAHPVRLTPACAGSTPVRRRRAMAQPTYPRVCGEHAVIVPVVGYGFDLPPRVRGALLHPCDRAAQLRLTPACAGSTIHSTGAVASVTTYPRVCGEHANGRCTMARYGDLPPRVRGARSTGASRWCTGRLTPACAGSTRRGLHCHVRLPTYPRVCGEHVIAASDNWIDADLPPRVRGARWPASRQRDRCRLTPACAGSTSHTPHRQCATSTYPRVCGEHTGSRSTNPCTTDLPPRVRGARSRSNCGHGERRLTPACAGSTALGSSTCSTASTYPRVCGEHHTVGRIPRAVVDLPPRVRGARVGDQRASVPVRLTPACAGSTTHDRLPMPQCPTYPRVCGEHECEVAHYPLGVDLPPRVRGAHTYSVLTADPHRLTPACAGSTSDIARPSRAHSTYPRVCGEHSSTSSPPDTDADLPPRVRGALTMRATVRCPSRLTPACAGSTSHPSQPGPSTPTYPRVCGEHPHHRRAMCWRSDLPPRVRGAPSTMIRSVPFDRLTPACAGST